MISELLEDFSDALGAIPSGHPRRRTLRLLDEAVRRDGTFLDRHPTALFQCLWNSAWWFDCPQAEEHYYAPRGGWGADGPPWEGSGWKLHEWLQAWRQA